MDHLRTAAFTRSTASTVAAAPPKPARRTETSRTYSMRVDELNAAVYAVQLRLGLMEEGSYVEIPVEPVEPVTQVSYSALE